MDKKKQENPINSCSQRVSIKIIIIFALVNGLASTSSPPPLHRVFSFHCIRVYSLSPRCTLFCVFSSSALIGLFQSLLCSVRCCLVSCHLRWQCECQGLAFTYRHTHTHRHVHASTRMEIIFYSRRTENAHCTQCFGCVRACEPNDNKAKIILWLFITAYSLLGTS